MITHIEEGLVRVLASGVVRIDTVFLARLVLGLFDVPEDVLGHLFEDLGVQWLGQALIECAAQVCHVVVLLSFLEGIKFAGEDLVPLLNIVASVLNLIVHLSVDLIKIIRIDLLKILDLFKLGTEYFLTDLVCEVSIGHLNEEGAVL